MFQNVIRPILFVLLVLIVLSAGSIPHLFFNNILSALSYVLLIAGYAILNKRFTQTEVKIIFLSLIIWALIIGINYLLTDLLKFNVVVYLKFYLKILFLVLVYNLFEKCSFNISSNLYFLLKLILYQSIAGFFLGMVLEPFLINIDTPEFRVQSFLFLFFYASKSNLLGIDFFRNQGIFWEPGVLQFFLNMLLIYSLFVYKNTRIAIACIFAVLTTNSTTGLMITTVIVGYRFISLKKMSPLMVAGVIISGIFVVGAMFLYVQMNVNDKLHGEGALSSKLRTYDMLQCLSIMRDYPITGIGLDNSSYLRYQENTFEYSLLLQAGLEVEDRGNTNSLLSMFAALGIPLGLLYFIFIVKQRTILSGQKALLVFLIVVTCLSEPLLLTTFFVLFPVMGLQQWLTKKKGEIPVSQSSLYHEA